ncbi:DUF4167 domain-containing protein [Altererythrobacter aquiaggeris]|uniref:DUF4167 domain-containing protein n=1 Tax=Aestuarierythrobacter aquiaggeris TaxID=1898396 RepID=UPI00301A21CE
MNNNNRNNTNNRRRGRSNSNRQQGGGGPNQLNRIDNRARGNAAQMLDKYKKLAHDSSLNGDRVQSEYYLQFADHYFRVIADNKARQDEQRVKRDDQRGDNSDGSNDSDDDRSQRQPRARRDDNDQDTRGQNSRNQHSQEKSPRGQRGSNQNSRDDSDSGSHSYSRADRDSDSDRQQAADDRPKAVKPRTRRPSKPVQEGALDMAILPPAIGAASGDAEAPKKVRKPRVRKPSPDESDTLKAVS